MPKYQLQVEVRPQYLPNQSEPRQSVYSFAYTVTITNTGEIPVQVISRYWNIADALGHVEEVRGLGVVGHQPLLKPGEAFQYTSGCRLRTGSGMMHGNYFCVAEDGERFETPIPAFALDAGGDAARVLH